MGGISNVNGSGSNLPPSSYDGGDSGDKKSKNVTSDKVNAQAASSLHAAPSNSQNVETPYSVVNVSSLISKGEKTPRSHRVLSWLQKGLGRLAKKVGRAVRNTVGSIFPTKTSSSASRSNTDLKGYSPSALRGLRLMFTDFWKYKVLRATPKIDGIFATLDSKEAEDMAAYMTEYTSALEKRNLIDPERLKACREVADKWKQRAKDLRDKDAAKKFLQDPLGRKTPNYKSEAPGEYVVGNSKFYDGPGVDHLHEVDTGFWLDMQHLSDVVLSREIQTGLRAQVVLKQSMPQLEDLESQFKALQEACDSARGEIKESGWTKDALSQTEVDGSTGSSSRAQQTFQRFVDECRKVEISFGGFGEHVSRLAGAVSRGLAAAGEAIRRCFSCCKGKTDEYEVKKDLPPEGLALAEALAKFADEIGIERGEDGHYDIPWVEQWRKGVPVIEGEGAEAIYESMLPTYELMDLDIEDRRKLAIQNQHYQVPRSSDYDIPRATDYDYPRSIYPEPPKMPTRYELERMDITQGFREAVYASFVAGMYNFVVTQPQDRIPTSEQVESCLREMLDNGPQTFFDLMSRWNRDVDDSSDTGGKRRRK
ncbi:type III secretion system early effector TepP [Chlamydia suis]|uniref:Uncharacterized protein n=1 Tax=Chlamydia suis TaxID=83559 RepID=A0ABX6IQH6_9CHLA|nr:hypothetical protein [Chlamydia suis]QHP83168.1 hypothetical protein Chls_293 [Chlamydia suis]